MKRHLKNKHPNPLVLLALSSTLFLQGCPDWNDDDDDHIPEVEEPTLVRCATNLAILYRQPSIKRCAAINEILTDCRSPDNTLVTQKKIFSWRGIQPEGVSISKEDSGTQLCASDNATLLGPGEFFTIEFNGNPSQGASPHYKTEIEIIVRAQENAETVVFEDTEFVDTDWHHEELYKYFALEKDYSDIELENLIIQDSPGGNPGAYQQGKYHTGNLGYAVYGHYSKYAFYDLARGAIISLDVEYDFILKEKIPDSPATSGDHHALRSFPLLVQGGLYFTAFKFPLSPFIRIGTPGKEVLPKWTSRQPVKPDNMFVDAPPAIRLTSEDFIHINSDFQITHPNFSSNGERIYFGYYTKSWGANYTEVTGGIDNWKVTVVHEVD